MSNNNLNNQLIKAVLEKVYINDGKKNIVEAGMISSLAIKDGGLNLIIEFPEEMVIDQQYLTNQIEILIKEEFKSLKAVRIIFTTKKITSKPTQLTKIKHKIANVEKVILFASAKGGVGKSTTALNVALAMSGMGYRVGIIDADIYGPTIPKLLGINQTPEVEKGKMLPIKRYGIHSISIGYLTNEDQAMIWRGPMVSKALYQLLVGVKWPELDYLIVDMPPGTGDIYLSLAENFIIDGVVLLSTPQHIALSMIKKSISFFNKTNIPIVGIVENMSYFIDLNRVVHYLFGANLTDKIAKNFGISLLGNIPIFTKISEFSDKGLSLQQEQEFSPYIQVAEKLVKFSL